MSIESPDFADFATEFEDWYYVATDLLAAAEALEPKIYNYWRTEREKARKRKASGGVPVIAASLGKPRALCQAISSATGLRGPPGLLCAAPRRIHTCVPPPISISSLAKVPR